MDRSTMEGKGTGMTVEVTAVTVTVDRTERDRTKGITRDARLEVQAYATQVLGWEDFQATITRQSAEVSTFVVTRKVEVSDPSAIMRADRKAREDADKISDPKLRAEIRRAQG